MLQLTVKYIFNRKGKARNSADIAPLEMYIHFDGVKRYRKIFKIEKRQWDEKNQQIQKHPNKSQMNIRLRNIKNKAENFHLEYLNENKSFTAKALLAHLDGKSETNETLITFADQYVKSRLAKMKPTTVKKYRSLINKLEGFQKEIHLTEIDYSWVMRFEVHLLSQKVRTGGYMQKNSSNSYLRLLKVLLKEANRLGLISSDPFGSIKIKNEQTKKDHLTLREIDMITELDLSTRRGKVELCRDIFVFQCLTGLRISDIRELKVKHIKDVDGQPVMIKELKKTRDRGKKAETGYCNVPLNIFFQGRAWRLIQPYLSGKLSEALVFGSVDTRTINQNIKEFVVEIGSSKKVTSKTGRHSCGTNLRDAGISKDVIQKVLGHSNIASTEVYAKTTMDTVLKEARKAYKAVGG